MGHFGLSFFMISRSLNFALGSLLMWAPLVAAKTEWNRFRGPNGTGHVETAGLPVTVDEGTKLWQVPLGKGWSSPVLWGEMVVVTAETAPNKRAVMALAVSSGKELWRYEVEFVPHKIHNFNSLASSSAFIDAERIYINWSTGTTIQALALDHQGKLAWKMAS
jgi:outer membrane protein assembly factor BamB